MFKLTPLKPVLSWFSFKQLHLFGSIFVVCFVFLTINLLSPQKTSAAVSNTINFQAKLQTSGGAIVADGNYNVEFKIYKSLSSGTSAQGVCVGGVTDDCLWLETRTGGNQVRVANGYLTVSLGSVTAFGSIDWNQQLWLTMRVGGTGGSPSWDAEMSPRIQLTAVPYAFQAGELGNGTNKATLTSSGDLQLQQASTLSTTTGNLTVQAASTLSLQTAGGTSSSSVSLLTGNASAGNSGSITLDVGTATGTKGSINIGNTNPVAAINIGAIGSTTNATTLHIADSSGAAQTVYLGSTNGSSATTIQGGTSNITLQTNSSSASIIVKTGTNSATGFVVQDTGSNQIFGVDTSGAQVLFGKAGTYDGKLVLYSGTASNTNTITVKSGNTSASYTITLPTAIGSAGQCLAVNSVASGNENLGYSSCSGAGAGTVTINLIPEYVGATFSQYDYSGSSSGTNTGFMQSDHVAGLSSGQGYKHNYYQWSTDQSAAQDYHIITEYQLPTGFNSFATGTFKIWTYIDSSTSTDLKFTMADVDGTVCYSSLQSIKPGSTGTWTQTTLSDPGNGCSFAAGDIVTMDIKLVAIQPSTNFVKVGELQFGYN